MSDNSPVFIHALYRTRSTWWWQKFREQSDFTAFYEPFHQNLIDRTHAQCEKSHFSKDKAAIFRHPRTSDHYFREYNLRDDVGGVALFDRHFVMENYVMEAGDQMPGLYNFVQSLLDQAKQSGTRAALQFNQTALRAEWLKANFGGSHIYLHRDPDYIMNSTRSFLTDETEGAPRTDFIALYLMIVAQNAAHPLFANVTRAYGLEPFHGDSFKEEFSHFNTIAEDIPDQDMQDMIGYLWFVGLGHATRYADLIIDQELLADSQYRQETQDAVKRVTGVDLSLDDFKHHSIEHAYSISDRMKNLIRQNEPLLKADWSRLQGVAITEKARNLLSSLGVASATPQVVASRFQPNGP